MKTLHETFQDLLNKLPQLSTSANEALKKLEDKIIEVENRMVCVTKMTNDIYQTISKYTENVDKNEPFRMLVDDHDVIHRGCHDINITLDLNDDEPITNNWYNQFVNEELLEEDKIEIIYPEGTILEWENYIYGYKAHPGARVELTEDFTNKSEYVRVRFLDNRSGGQGDGGYCIEMFKEIDEEPRKSNILEIITTLCDMNITGEEMEFIIEKVGMTDQMLRQLIMNNPESDTKDLLAEKIETNDMLVGN